MATYLRYRFESDGIRLGPDDVDYEDFLAFLDIEHNLELAGSDTWSSDGNETQVIVKNLIGQVLVERTPKTHELPEIYYEFASQLGYGDYVLTFNYDILLEQALEHVGRRYRLFPSRYFDIRRGMGSVDTSMQEVVVIKLHGSVDWFDRATYIELEKSHAEFGLTKGPDHPVFGPDAGLRVRPLLEGPQFDDDPMLAVQRVVDGLERYYRDPLLFRAAPLLLTPSRFKALYADRFKYFWRGLGQAGGMNLGVVIIGYSLPPHDEYAKQVLFRIVRNYQDSWWGQEILGGMRKAPVLLIDKQPDSGGRTAFLSRYGFVDEHKARMHFSGFDRQALRLIREPWTA